MKYALLTKRKSVVICEEDEVESLSKKGYKLKREADSLQVLEIAKRDIEATFSKKKRRRYIILLVLLFVGYYFFQLYVGDERAGQVFGEKGEASTRDLCAARSELGSIARKGFDDRVDGDLGIECVQLGIN
ncbi:hypothetical protein [Vibrio cionasavignyae]|uniref:hypothetical protein n=1 Tax=Vibrio cionasavignyae TaxID=2910252 RepID=UPI003D1193C4